jgi:hypothetical protein
VVSVRGALNRIVALGQPRSPASRGKYGAFHDLYLRIDRSGLFDPDVYRSQHADLAEEDPWRHFLHHGLAEGRQFTNAETVARSLAQIQPEFVAARGEFLKTATYAQDQTTRLGAKLRDKRVKIGIYCSKLGNFYMHEIADLLHLGLRRFDVEAFHRHEQSDKDENFDIRIFVEPHEFFMLGEGVTWQ